MNLSSFIRVFGIGATLLSVSAQGQGQGRGRNRNRNDDKEQDDKEGVARGRNDKCWTCEQTSGCFECLSLSDNGDGTATVELDFSECKDTGADSIGWACCTGSSDADGVFKEGECDVPNSGCFGKNNKGRDPEGGSPRCNRVSTMFVTVPSDATSVAINTQDGFTGNDASPRVGAHPICAGGNDQGGPCAKKNNGLTSHCLETIDLSSCPTTGALPSPTVSPTASATEMIDVTSAPTVSATETIDVTSAPTVSATETIDITSAPTASPSVKEVSSVAPTASATETIDITSAPSSLAPTPTPTSAMDASSDAPTTGTADMSDSPSTVPTATSDAPSLTPTTTSDVPSPVPTTDGDDSELDG